MQENEIFGVLNAYHSKPYGGNFPNNRTTYKVLRSGYYWPSLFKDAKKFVSSCDTCQRMGRLVPSDEMPLQTQISIEPFEKWALDFMVLISPMSKKKKYILVFINYVTKWLESKAFYVETEKEVVELLFEDIFTRFGVP